MRLKIYELNNVSSTMHEASKLLVSKTAVTPFVVFAHSQTSGKGRFSREFISPYDSGIYMTIVLSAEKGHSFLSLNHLPIIAATVSKFLIKKYSSKSIKYKWVNDLFIENKKVGGILCEKKEFDGQCYYLVGIGINISRNNYNYPKLETNQIGQISNNDFKLKKSIEYIAETFLAYTLSQKLISFATDDYKKYQYLQNKKVCIKLGNEEIGGIFKGVTKKGEALLESNNNILKISAGEVIKVEW